MKFVLTAAGFMIRKKSIAGWNMLQIIENLRLLSGLVDHDFLLVFLILKAKNIIFSIAIFLTNNNRLAVCLSFRYYSIYYRPKYGQNDGHFCLLFDMLCCLFKMCIPMQMPILIEVD